jgi:hypothetical protein
MNSPLLLYDFLSSPLLLYSPFVFSWRAHNTLDIRKLPLPCDGCYDFIVEWGDGTSSHIRDHGQAEASHRYQAAGTYRVHVTEDIVGFCARRRSVMEISQWGCLRLTTAARAFKGT